MRATFLSDVKNAKLLKSLKAMCQYITGQLEYAVEWGDHQEWANDYMDKNLTQEERFAAMVEINASGMVKNSPDVIGAADYLVRRGWVLLHNPQQGIAIPTRDITREYTKAQKEFLYDYYMERDCRKEANAIWQE